MKFLFNNTYIIIDKILSMHPFSPISLEEYESRQKGIKQFNSLFKTPSVPEHFRVDDICQAILGEDVKYHGLIFPAGSIIEFDSQSCLKSAQVKKCRYLDIYIPEYSTILFDTPGEPEAIILSKDILYKNKLIRKGTEITITEEEISEYELEIINTLYKNKRTADFVVESERFYYDNYEDGGKNLGYPCRERGRYGSLSTFDKLDNELLYYDED